MLLFILEMGNTGNIDMDTNKGSINDTSGVLILIPLSSPIGYLTLVSGPILAFLQEVKQTAPILGININTSIYTSGDTPMNVQQFISSEKAVSSMYANIKCFVTFICF